MLTRDVHYAIPSGSDPVSRFVIMLVDIMIRAAPRLEPSRKIAEMVARYAGVGVLSSLLYAVIVVAAVSGLHINHDLATLLAYAIVAPLNFAMHRGFTFHSSDVIGADLTRYIIVQGVSLVVALSVMAFCVDLLGLPYAIGVVGAVVLVPVITFLVMDRWVFAQKVI